MADERSVNMTVPNPNDPKQMALILQDLQRTVADLLEAIQAERLRHWLD